MSEHESLNGIATTLKDSASVRNVYGEPIHAGEKTIIPVANVAYGFGGGEGKDEEHGFGGGGGMRAKPVGVLEVTGGETKWIPLNPARTLLMAAGIGLMAGVVLGGRRANRKHAKHEAEEED